MPYIEQIERPEFSPVAHGTPSAITSGQLNYQICELVINFLEARQLLNRQTRYTDYNEAIGAIECAKQEIYRKLIVPYEERKIRESGDVF